MAYRPTIYVLDTNSTHGFQTTIMDEIMCKWPHGMPPLFSQDMHEVEAALVIADGYQELTRSLPILLELHNSEIPIILCCDDYGDLYDFIHEIGLIQLAYDAEASTIAGVLFGTIERNGQVAKLRSQVGLVKHVQEDLEQDLSILQDELETAATVQREFMSTEMKDMHGISFSSLWRPASIVSGDMYDITQLDDDHVAIFIVDAIGHGISAAMLAMMLTRTLSANRFDPSTGQFAQPHEVLNHLNQALLERTGDSARFATAAYCILNCKTNELTYAGAGHPPTLLSSIGKGPTLLESEGPLLGVFEDGHFPEYSVKLNIGDTILMYSDGFEFALGNSNYKKNEIPTHLLSMHEFCKESNGDVIGSIGSYLHQTGSITAEDDLTMICLRANTVPASFKFAA